MMRAFRGTRNERFVRMRIAQQRIQLQRHCPTNTNCMADTGSYDAVEDCAALRNSTANKLSGLRQEWRKLGLPLPKRVEHERHSARDPVRIPDLWCAIALIDGSCPSIGFCAWTRQTADSKPYDKRTAIDILHMKTDVAKGLGIPESLPPQIPRIGATVWLRSGPLAERRSASCHAGGAAIPGRSYGDAIVILTTPLVGALILGGAAFSCLRRQYRFSVRWLIWGEYDRPKLAQDQRRFYLASVA
eukprot:2920209-Pleurochrysis_carterae.AAC.1